MKNHQVIYGKSSKTVNLITKWFLVKINFFVSKAKKKINRGSCLSLQDQQLSLNDFFCKVPKKKVTVFTKMPLKGLNIIENCFFIYETFCIFILYNFV